MKNMFDYIDEFGDLSFLEKEVTEVDILIFAVMSYADFTGVVTKNKYLSITLSEAWKKAKDQNRISKGIAHKNAVKILNMASEKKRYRDLILMDYEYVLSNETQFGALTIKVPKNRIYVCFEGTDDSIAGWKEDFALSYKYPTEAQKMAGKYLNRILKITGEDAVICGHSKGANLALVGAMRTNLLKRKRITKIYSFDGPGLKESEFNSKKYLKVRDRLINIIPNRSLVGVLFKQENTDVIKSSSHGIMQHDAKTWVIKSDKFVRCKQDRMSIRLDESINKWLCKYDYKERENIVNSIFSCLENSNIKSINDIKKNRVQSIYNIIKSSLDLSHETREVLFNCMGVLLEEITVDTLEDGKNFVKSYISKK